MSPHAAGAAPSAVYGRQVWLDLARGLAVVSMIIAHTSPWGGVLNLTEYLSAPWFAFIMGISLWIASSRAGHRGRFVVSYLIRGAILVILGIVLQSMYGQIDVVLQTLGLTTIVLAPIARLLERRWIATGVAAVMTLVSPLAMDAARTWLSTGGSQSPAVDQLIWWLAAGSHYRVTSMIAFVAAGMAAARFLGQTGLRSPARTISLAVVFLLGAGTVYLLGRLTPAGAAAYSGTTTEILGAILLSFSATWFCVWLETVLGSKPGNLTGPFEATGRMALSAYSLQIVALAVITRTVIPGQRDDHWWVMFGLIALCVGACWLWLQRFRQGPLEWLIRLPEHRPGRVQ